MILVMDQHALAWLGFVAKSDDSNKRGPSDFRCFLYCILCSLLDEAFSGHNNGRCELCDVLHVQEVIKSGPYRM